MKHRKLSIVSSVVLMVVALAFLMMPTYVREAAIYGYPDISDTSIFATHRVAHADTTWEWPVSFRYNAQSMDSADNAYLDELKSVAFVVIQHDSILHEEYRGGWTAGMAVNLFSATKSIVGLLVGIAVDEGLISSVDDPVGKYIPEFREGGKAKITVRNLLTMSSGLKWDEAYSTLFSMTTHAYYGDDLRELVTGLEPESEPGVQYSYKSGDTQLLTFVLEAATGRTISEYASEKLWKPLQTSHDASWSLDKEGGDEKGYCCFNTTALDLARIGRLILHGGEWNGQRVISETYLQEATSPASYLENEFGDGPLDYYGFQIWIVHYHGMDFPAFRGLGGQYLFVVPQKDAIIVRLGHKRGDRYIRENTVDLMRYLDIAFKMLE